MVNPKKDYELLMRYLQGGELKRRDAMIPETTYPDDWEAAPEPDKSNSITDAYPEQRVARTISKPESWKRFLPKFKTVSLSHRFRLIIAAIALVVLAICVWNAVVLYKLSPDTLYKKLYVPYTIKDATNTQPTEKTSLVDYYTAGNYVAVTLQSKKQQKLSDREKLVTGLAYLQRDDYTAAIKRLEPLSNNFKSPYRHDAEFYLALTYLKNGDYDRCIVKMEQIAYTPSNPYHSLISPGTIREIKMLKWK